MDLWTVVNQNPRNTKGFLQLGDSGALESTTEMVPWGKQEKSTTGSGQSIRGQSLETQTTRLRTVDGNLNT